MRVIDLDKMHCQSVGPVQGGQTYKSPCKCLKNDAYNPLILAVSDLAL